MRSARILDVPWTVRMTGTRFSLRTLLLTIAFSAANFAVIRWGLEQPNLKAGGMFQEIVVGGTPMASLLALGAILTTRTSTRRDPRRGFWIGFVATGTFALGFFVFSCLRFKWT